MNQEVAVSIPLIRTRRNPKIDPRKGRKKHPLKRWFALSERKALFSPSSFARSTMTRTSIMRLSRATAAGVPL